MTVDITNSLPPIGKQIQDKIAKFDESHPSLVAEKDPAEAPAITPEPEEGAPAAIEPAVEETPAPIEPGEATPPADPSLSPIEDKKIDDDWEDVELDDEDTNYKYKFKAKKTEAEYLKNAYLRQSDYSRKTASLAKQRAWLTPMIESGDLDKIAPLIQLASTDPVLATGFLELYQRRIQNQPLVYSQPGYEPQTQRQGNAPQTQLTQAQSQVDYAQALLQDDTVDDYTKGAVLKALEPAMQELNQLKAFVAQQQQQQSDVHRQQEALSIQRQQWTQAMTNAHAQLAQAYPNEFQGPNSPNAVAEVAKLAELDRIATAANLRPEDWGYVGRFSKALEIRNSRPASPAAPAFAPSVAAQTIAEMSRQAKDIATSAAAKAASSVASGMSTGSVPPPVAPKKRSYKGSDGKPLPMVEAIRKAAMNAEDKTKA